MKLTDSFIVIEKYIGNQLLEIPISFYFMVNNRYLVFMLNALSMLRDTKKILIRKKELIIVRILQTFINIICFLIIFDIIRNFKTDIEKIRESILEERLLVHRKKEPLEDILDDMSIGSEDEDEDADDALEWNQERIELMKVSGKTVKTEDAPVIHRFYEKMTYLVKAEQFPEHCPLELYLLDEDLWRIDGVEKIKYLFAVLHNLQENKKERIEQLVEDLEYKLETKEDLEAAFRADAIRDVRVVGMTITGASINNRLLNMINPEIVLVEEAAEVLECQLITTLGSNLKHLIMIGDHKQLPPQVSNYKLKVKYKLDVSMMQRLIQNRVPFVQLQYQNRMRPDLADLLRDIYPDLKSNLSRVNSIQIPSFLSHSAIFWSHSEKESSERSKTNIEEVHRALSLAMLFVAFGYSPSDITILCTYLGQTSLMKKEARNIQVKYPDTLKENAFVISTVDNYQGDENQIVIVSLVRGNPSGTVGFLKDMERRCVAQSRAKACVVYIGNQSTVKNANCWRILMSQIPVESELKVACPKHPSSVHFLSNTQEVQGLASHPSSICPIKCSVKFTCAFGHPCSRKCQPVHDHKTCRTKIPFVHTVCRHRGVKECFKDPTQELCMEIVDFVFPKCGHPETR